LWRIAVSAHDERVHETNDKTQQLKGPPVRFAIMSVIAFVCDESGQDLIEYALVAALVGLGAVLSLKGLSTKVSNAFNSIGTSLTGNV
jgi:pilus assembly protein Flp/PilA